MKYLSPKYFFLMLLLLGTIWANEYSNNTIKNGGIIFLKVWSKHITTVDGPRCSFNPTCAGYARQAIAKYGPRKGYFMAMERLQRCHSCHDYSQYNIKEGRFDDPVEAHAHN